MPQLAGRPLIHSLEVYRIIGCNLKILRQEIPISQAKLAQYLGICHDTVFNIEKGQCRAEYALLREIADLFRLETVDELAIADSAKKLRNRQQVLTEIRAIFQIADNHL